MPTVFVPFNNFSLARGRLNAGGLTRADGVAHTGYGYAAPAPLVEASSTFDSGVAAPDLPRLAHYNPNSGAASGKQLYIAITRSGATHLYAVADVGGSMPLTVNSLGSVGAITDPNAGQLFSYGLHEILCLGHDNDVQIRVDGAGAFTTCFTSSDQPRAKYGASLGLRALFGNIANTGSAGSPDPNTQLVVWTATDDVRTVSNAVADPELGSDFQYLADDYGDITGLSGGRRSAYIFKERGINVMLLTSSIYGYTFDTIATGGFGCRQPRSIARFGDEVYYWSELGPAVIRDGQALLLGDGFWTHRSLLSESPAHPNFTVLDSAIDEANGCVLWLVEMDTTSYDYAESEAGGPLESVSGETTGRALICYSVLANEFSFLWRSADSIYMPLINFNSDPPASELWYIRNLVGGMPWDQYTMPLGGVAFIAHQNGPEAPRLLFSGFNASFDSFDTPEYVIGQNPSFSTGLVQLPNLQNGSIHGVRPVMRARRGFSLPTVSVNIGTCMTPFDDLRMRGPYTSDQTGEPRTGWIRTPGVPMGNFAVAEVEIASWSGDPLATKADELAYLVQDIEGIEVDFGGGGNVGKKRS